MKTTFLRTVRALGALIPLISFAIAQHSATAQQSLIGNLMGRSSSNPSEIASDFDVELASYMNGDVMEEIPPYEGEVSSDCDECNESCTCGDCQGGCGGGCASCDGCACDIGSSGGCCECGSCDGCACDSCDCCGDACGCQCGPCGCDDCCNGCCGDCCNSNMNAGMYYAEIQNIFMRAHVNDQVVGKLREKYEWSPRLIFGYEAASGVGGRLRYWSYSRTTTTVPAGNSLRFDFDVVDAEGTMRFSSKRADLLLSGGVRYADMKLAEDNDDEVYSQMPGATFAADVRAGICCGCNSQWSGVCGARWSLLGGDWEGDDNVLVQETFDDNVTAHEIYGGFEYLCRHCGYDLYARLVFEMQNWHSDALGENSATDSIGFVGPAIHTGVSF